MFSGGVIPTHSPRSMVSVTSRDCTKPGLTPLVTPVLLIQQTVHVWLDVCMCGFVRLSLYVYTEYLGATLSHALLFEGD